MARSRRRAVMHARPNYRAGGNLVVAGTEAWPDEPPAEGGA
jgi:hypothetical protein